VTVLSTADPVRVHQDFASLDLVSGGRAEIIAGRSAFTEPFGLFGVDLSQYDEIFAEKLDLLLALREGERVTWSGRSGRRWLMRRSRPARYSRGCRCGWASAAARAARSGRGPWACPWSWA
jgi:alkanesulfonate monooxygenase SsuD/methylene tetrahydromethanopterin reductase-like flavin-dependent oxidoreductase (luciferase family)